MKRTPKQQCYNIEEAVTKFNKMMKTKKNVVSYANWSLCIEEVEPELSLISASFGVSKKIIMMITDIR